MVRWCIIESGKSRFWEVHMKYTSTLIAVNDMEKSKQFYLYDPDKHIIEVGEKLDAVVLRFIQSGLSAEETAAKMDIPIDFVNSWLDNR